MDDPDSEISKLKRSFNDIMDAFNLEGKSKGEMLRNGSQFKRDILVEAVFKLKEVCESTFDLFKSEPVQISVASKVVDKVKSVLNEMVPVLVTNALKSRDSKNSKVNDDIANGGDEKHVIVIEDKDDNENKTRNLGRML